MSVFELLDKLTLLSPVVLLLGLIIGSYYFTYLDKAFKVLTVYLLVAFLTDISSRIYGSIVGNNLIFILLFGFFELLIFGLFYWFLLDRKKNPMLIAGFVLCMGYIVWEIISLESVETDQFQSYARVVDSFYVIFLAVFFFFEKLQKGPHIERDFLFLNSIVLIFFALNFVFLLPINFLVNQSNKVIFIFWTFNLFITITFYTVISLSIWKNGKIRKSLQFGS